MNRLVLYDIDSEIPNLALMKLSAFHKRQGWSVRLVRVRGVRPPPEVEADKRLGSVVFYRATSAARVARLRARYGEGIACGGSGVSLAARLPPEVEASIPDYTLYRHTKYALGFLTRGCNKRCAFCVVPAKEGPIKRRSDSFEDFVPKGQRNVMLLDDNLLSYEGVEALLEEIILRNYAVNFNQTLDIAYLSEPIFRLLRRIDYRNARFNNRMIYFSLNYPRTIQHFRARREWLREFGEDCVTVVCIYGFDTSLSQDYERFRWLKRLRLIPFFQEYWPIPGVPARLPTQFFDMDLRPFIRLTFRSNGYNWEKYLRWLNRFHFQTFGRFFRPLLEILFRYNNKHCYDWYRRRPELLTDELYRDFRDSPPKGFACWSDYIERDKRARGTPQRIRAIFHSFQEDVESEL